MIDDISFIHTHTIAVETNLVKGITTSNDYRPRPKRRDFPLPVSWSKELVQAAGIRCGSACSCTQHGRVQARFARANFGGAEIREAGTRVFQEPGSPRGGAIYKWGTVTNTVAAGEPRSGAQGPHPAMGLIHTMPLSPTPFTASVLRVTRTVAGSRASEAAFARGEATCTCLLQAGLLTDEAANEEASLLPLVSVLSVVVQYFTCLFEHAERRWFAGAKRDFMVFDCLEDCMWYIELENDSSM